VAANIDMLSGEEVVFSTEKHWIAPVRDSWIPALMIVGAFVIGSISPEAESGIGGFFANFLGLLRTGLFIGGAAWIVYNIVVWRTATFVITNMRVVREEGVVRRRSSASMLASVTDVQSRVGIVGKSLGYGDLLIMGPAGEKASDRFATINHPTKFRDELMSAAHSTTAATTAASAARAKPAVATAPSPPAPSQSDELEALTKLAKLRDAGAITPEEYDAKKAEILARV
jgi:uncharacterized membrane protein YdbT with pleckstrin-like domain